MQELARAYNQKLQGSFQPLCDGVLDIINRQITILYRLSGGKVLNYVIALKECVKSLLNDNQKPSPRILPREGGINRVLALELELFALLDGEDNPLFYKIKDYENRVLSLLCYLAK